MELIDRSQQAKGRTRIRMHASGWKHVQEKAGHMECDPFHLQKKKAQTSANIYIKYSDKAVRGYNRVLTLRMIQIFFLTLVLLKFSIMNITSL